MIELRVRIEDKANGRTGIVAETHDYRKPSASETKVAEQVFSRVGQMILEAAKRTGRGFVVEQTGPSVKRNR